VGGGRYAVISLTRLITSSSTSTLAIYVDQSDLYGVTIVGLCVSRLVRLGESGGSTEGQHRRRWQNQKQLPKQFLLLISLLESFTLSLLYYSLKKSFFLIPLLSAAATASWCGDPPRLPAIIKATTVNNARMPLISATSFIEGGTHQPRHVAQ
jgi:hypothetical protein